MSILGENGGTQCNTLSAYSIIVFLFANVDYQVLYLKYASCHLWMLETKC